MNKNLDLPQRYVRTRKAAYYLDVSDDFLENRMDGDFQEGIHYFKPANCRITRWDLNALEEWIQKSMAVQTTANNLILKYFIA